MAWHWLEKLLALTCTLGLVQSQGISQSNLLAWNNFLGAIYLVEDLPDSSRYFRILIAQYRSILLLYYYISSYCTLYMFLSYTIFYIYMCIYIYIVLHWHCVRVLLPTPTATRLQSMKRSIELRRNKYTKEREAMSAPWTQHDATSKDRQCTFETKDPQFSQGTVSSEVWEIEMRLLRLYTKL